MILSLYDSLSLSLSLSFSLSVFLSLFVHEKGPWEKRQPILLVIEWFDHLIGGAEASIIISLMPRGNALWKSRLRILLRRFDCLDETPANRNYMNSSAESAADCWSGHKTISFWLILCHLAILCHRISSRHSWLTVKLDLGLDSFRIQMHQFDPLLLISSWAFLITLRFQNYPVATELASSRLGDWKNPWTSGSTTNSLRLLACSHRFVNGSCISINSAERQDIAGPLWLLVL